MKLSILLFGALILVVLGSCTIETLDPRGQRSFSSVDELSDYLASTNTQGTFDGMMRNGGFAPQMMMDAVAESAAPSSGSSESKSVTYTGTNVQVEGVDEADILKTDGHHIYTIIGRSIAIIKSLPAEETAQIGMIDLEHVPQGLFLDGDTLIVIGTEWDTSSYTIISGYDLSDPEDPIERFEHRVEGSYVTARMTDRAYIVVQSMPDAYRPIPMPIIFENGVRSNVAIERIMLPAPVDDARFVTIAEINDGSIETMSIITEGYPTIYASERAIHLAMGRYVDDWTIRQEETRRIAEPYLTVDDQDLIARIESTSSDIVSASEKRMKTNNVIAMRLSSLEREKRDAITDAVEEAVKSVLESHESFEYTDLVEVAYATLEASEPVEIQGSVNNQFSLDEYDGVLRVATTTNPRWSLGEGMNDMENHVYTIRDGRVLDSVHGLAPSERIFSARFMGERLYLVTFRQVDPFFAIDLSDPQNIEVLGELKIPGFSRYLHAYSDDIIIGLGRDASESGVQRGLKISLFDVSDPTKPIELTNWISDERYVSSSAEWEHKAFLLDVSNDLLVIPISGSRSWVEPLIGWDIERRVPESRDGGALVFTISEGSIDLRGLVAHPGYGGVERSLVIEDALYTKSDTLLRVNALNDLDELARVTLSEGRDVPVY
jgi:inhibitor of cysteine peptidase